jgi:hypothetical protein
MDGGPGLDRSETPEPADRVVLMVNRSDSDSA